MTFITSRMLIEAPPLASVRSEWRLARSSSPLRPWNERPPPTLRPLSKAAMFPLPMLPGLLIPDPVFTWIQICFQAYLDGLPFLSPDQQVELELPFTLGELQFAVEAAAASKAPGSALGW